MAAVRLGVSEGAALRRAEATCDAGLLHRGVSWELRALMETERDGERVPGAASTSSFFFVSAGVFRACSFWAPWRIS